MANVITIPPIAERISEEEQAASSETQRDATNPRAEIDKYETEVDPIVLRKGRAVAKAGHTRVLNNIKKTDLHLCTLDMLENFKRQLIQELLVVNKRHARLVAFMLQPEETELEDEQSWIAKVHSEHNLAISNIDTVISALISGSSAQTSNQNNVTTEQVHAWTESNVINTAHADTPPEIHNNQLLSRFMPSESNFVSSSHVTPPRIVRGDQPGTLQGFFRQVRGFAARTWDALTPRRAPQPARIGPFGPRPLHQPSWTARTTPFIQRVPDENPPFRRRLEEAMNNEDATIRNAQHVVSNPPPVPVTRNPAVQVQQQVPMRPRVPLASRSGVVPHHQASEQSGFQHLNSNASYSPDAWIFESDEQHAISFFKPPKLQLMKFDGSPLNWPLFIQTFKVQVHDAVRSDAERIAHLGNCLPEHIRAQLGQLIIQPGLYRYALAELQRLYGSRQVIIKSCTTVLESLKSFTNNDYQGLSKLSNSLRSVVATMQLCGFEAELSSYSNVELVLRKLSPNLQDRWASAAWNLAELPSLVDLSDFLSEISMIEYTRRLSTTNQFSSSSRPTQPTRSSKPNRPSNQVATTSSFVQAAVSVVSCAVCNGNHTSNDCQKFKSMSIENRCGVVKEKYLCTRCLLTGHRSKECSTAKECGKNGCKFFHHPLLHGAPRIYPAKPSSSEAPNSSNHFTGAVHKSESRGTLLPVVPVRLEHRGRTVNTYAFLDQGSELSMLNGALAKELFLDGPATTMTIETVNGRAQQEFNKLPVFGVAARDGCTRFDLADVLSTEPFHLAIKTKCISDLQNEWPHLKDIEFATPNADEIGILIGADQPAVLEILEYRKDPLNPRAPRGLLTHFGWCVAGPYSTVGVRSSSCYFTRLFEADQTDDNFLKQARQFIGMDQYGLDAKSKPPDPPDVIQAIRIFENTKRFVDGHYELGLPWLNDEPLPDNREAALRWFYSQEARLMKNPELADKCRKALMENVVLGFVRKLTKEEENDVIPGRVWYNKYHPVINPNKPEKCRMVFDLSAVFSGVSLNSRLLKGPDLIANQVGVTLRFRRFRFAIVADIEKMFYQVWVRPADAPVFRYFWRDPGSKLPPAVYQMKVHLFGARSSPAVCCFALLQAAKDSAHHSEELLHEIVHQFYVDNWLNSFEKLEDAVGLATLLIDALKDRGFNLTQFAASHLEILRELHQCPNNEQIDMSLDAESAERTLGLVWLYRRDMFALNVKKDIPLCIKSKRELLSISSKIYDPLGFLASIKLTPKLLFQETCRRKMGWDDPLPDELVAIWEKWAHSLASLNGLEIPRCMQPPGAPPCSVELHTFADASEYAFGAIAYLRYVYEDHATCSLVMAKSNLAPIKPTTIPRNELNGALSAARLTRTLIDELKMNIAKVVYWTDSTTVLRWIGVPKVKFTAYVGARVGEILELTLPDQWHYVPTEQNPADDASRGIQPDHLTANHRWFCGPEFLTHFPDQWPSSPIDTVDDSNDPETRPTLDIFATTVVSDRISVLITDVSKIFRLCRIVAYVLRWRSFVQKARHERLRGEITVSELQNARKHLLLHEQLIAFSKEYECLRAGRSLPSNSSILSFRPFLDDDGLIRVGGRLSRGNFPTDVRQPILLPRSSRLTRLIIEDLHRPDGALEEHLSKDRTLQEVRRMYWLPKGRQTVAKIVHDCLRCKIKKKAVVTPVMADLPTGRLQHGVPAFTHTGLDYFGPFEVVLFRRRLKRWIVLFVCLTTRAVHLEIVFSMSTDSFLSCLWRFEARRGVPSHYYSDNGTYFVGAVNELTECLKNLDQQRIQTSLSRRGVTWHFNPPGAPHFGGVWERLVGSAKRAYGSVLYQQLLTDEVLSTATAQVENLLNSRPLTYFNDDPTELEVLTPNHLLLGRANPNLPPDVFTSSDLSARKYWRRAQSLATHFWRRWMQEYLPGLNQRRKWASDQRNLQVNDVVALLDSSNPRGCWKLARIVRTFPGSDGVIRSAEVKTTGTKGSADHPTNTTLLHRPVHKMVLLLPSDEFMCPARLDPGPAVCTNVQDRATSQKVHEEEKLT